jgi:hypothetical protein
MIALCINDAMGDSATLQGLQSCKFVPAAELGFLGDSLQIVSPPPIISHILAGR